MIQDAKTRERILMAARDEFSHLGYRGARMAAIAERAGINKALIHYYFENKEKLYAEVIKLVFGNSSEDDIPLYPGHWDLTCAQKLYACLYCFREMHVDPRNLKVMRISFWEFLEQSAHLNSIIEGITWPQHRLLTRIIEEGIERGEFNPVDTHLLSMNILSFIGLHGMNVSILADTDYYKNYLGKYDESHVLEFVFRLSISYLTGESSSTDVPDLPPDLTELIDRQLAYFFEGNREGMFHFMTGQLADILLEGK